MSVMTKQGRLTAEMQALLEDPAVLDRIAGRMLEDLFGTRQTKPCARSSETSGHFKVSTRPTSFSKTA